MSRDLRWAIILILSLLAVVGVLRDKEKDFIKQSVTTRTP